VTFLTKASEAEVLRAQLTAELADRRHARRRALLLGAVVLVALAAAAGAHHILDRPTVAERADAAEARELLEVWRSTMVEAANQNFTDADLTARHIDPSAYRVRETLEEFQGAGRAHRGLWTDGVAVRVLPHDVVEVTAAMYESPPDAALRTGGRRQSLTLVRGQDSRLRLVRVLEELDDGKGWG
jgi:hypothetical protein